MWKKHYKSLRRQLNAAVVVLAVGPLLTMGSILIWQSYQVQKEQAIELQREISVRAAEQIGYYIHSLEDELGLMARVSDLTNLAHEQQITVLSKIRSYKNYFHGDVFNEIVLIDDKGKELARVSRVTVYTDEDLGERSGDEFVKPMTEGKVYYGPILFDTDTGEPFIALGMPITDVRSGSAKGVIVAEVRLRDIWNLVSNIHIGKTGSAYILNSKGNVIAHKNPSLVLKGTRFIAPKEAGVYNGLSGRRAVIASRKIVIGSQELYIVTEMPASEALALTLYITLIGVLLLCSSMSGIIVLRLFIRRQIIRPIESLAGTARSIEGGNLSLKAEPAGNDEMDTLADAFNKMADRLLGTIVSLRLNVEERDMANWKLEEKTRELQELNLHLKMAIEDRERMGEELLNAKKLESVGILAAGIAHEINNPLANASFNVQILKKRTLDEKLLPKLEALERNIDKASIISKELLQFSSQRKFEMVPFNVNDVITSSLILIEHRLDKITVHKDLSSIPPVSGDPVRVEQVIVNILSNAVDAMPDGGNISVLTSLYKSFAVIKISDTGVGIPEPDISKVFDPFFTSKDVGVGTGLGLSICYGIIKKHGGAIEIQSSVGKGTTVTVKLPLIGDYEI